MASRSRSRWIRLTAAFALCALALFRFGDRAAAIQDSEDKVWFGPVGITPGQRALVNVYAVGNPDTIGDPDITPWNFVVKVFDRRGTLIQERQLRLPTGAIGSVDVAIQDDVNSLLTPLSRRTFRAEIVGFNPQPDPPGKWAATLEIVDRLTGRSTLVIGNPDVLPAATIVPPPGAAQ
jgi:hypothetical protein